MALTAAGAASPLRHIAGTDVLHWHGGKFDLPDDVVLLAGTSKYLHQAFARGRTLLALLFHAEMGEDPASQNGSSRVETISLLPVSIRRRCGRTTTGSDPRR